TVYNGCLCWTGIPVQPKTPEEGITRWQGKSVVFDASYNVFDDKVLRKNFNEFME
ncbi:TPA: phosphate starvation-inducible protein PsiE, partial [Shigella flexneri]